MITIAIIIVAVGTMMTRGRVKSTMEGRRRIAGVISFIIVFTIIITSLSWCHPHPHQCHHHQHEGGEPDLHFSISHPCNHPYFSGVRSKVWAWARAGIMRLRRFTIRRNRWIYLSQQQWSIWANSKWRGIDTLWSPRNWTLRTILSGHFQRCLSSQSRIFWLHRIPSATGADDL